MVVEQSPVYIIMVTVNRRLADQFARLCDVLDYGFFYHDSPLQNTTITANASMVIVDAVNTTNDIIRVRLGTIPTSIPILWIIPEDEARGTRPYVLYSPFTAYSALNIIQTVIRSTTEVNNTVAESFLHTLLKAKNPTQILGVLADHMATEYSCDHVGILQLSEDEGAEWLYWYEEPDSDTVLTLSGVVPLGDLDDGWMRFPFVVGDRVGAVVFHPKKSLQEIEKTILRDIIMITGRLWAREQALVTSYSYITELQMFEMLGRSIVGNLDLNQSLTNIVTGARSIAQADGCTLWLIRQKKIVTMAQAGEPRPAETEIAIDDHPIREILELTHPIVIDDFADEHSLYPKTQTCQLMCLPLAGAEETIGLITIVRQPDAKRSFSREDHWRLRNLASWSVIALNNADLHHEIQAALAKERESRDRMIQMERLTTLGQLVASVAHEVNNPLQIMQGSVDTIKPQITGGSESSIDAHLSVLQECIDQISSVIARVRNTYKVPGRDPVALDINSLLRQVGVMFETTLTEKNIVLDVNLTDDIPLVYGFEYEIRQVFLNLIRNALEAVNKNGMITVTSQHDEDEKMVQIDIKDTGAGIPPDILHIIFESFYTTKVDGSGLGLSITKEIIEQHHGSIKAMNQDGGGAHFRVKLPSDRA